MLRFFMPKAKKNRKSDSSQDVSPCQESTPDQGVVCDSMDQLDSTVERTSSSPDGCPYPESAFDQEGAGCDSMDRCESKTAALYNKSTLLKMKNLVDISLRGDETIDSLSQQAFTDVRTNYAELSQNFSSSLSKQNRSIKRKSTFSFCKAKSVPIAFLRSQKTPSFSGKSGLENTPTEELSEDDEKKMRQLMVAAFRMDAPETLKNIMEVIMSLAILKRCTNSDKIMDLEKARERLERFGAIFGESQKYLLGLIWEVEKLDEIAAKLDSQLLSFDDLQKEFVAAVSSVENGIYHIAVKQTYQWSSPYCAKAVQMFNEHKDELRKAAGKGENCLGEKNYGLLKTVCKQLKFGVMHEIVQSLDIELKKLAKGELNGYIFYPEAEETSLKARPCPPFLKPGAKSFEDYVDAIDNPQKADKKDPESVQQLFDDWETLATLYLSSYIPELAEEGPRKSKQGEDYFECDISLVTNMNLFGRDKKKKRLPAMSLYGKFNGVLQDHRRLKQDKGYLQEENKLLRQESEELRAQLRALQCTTKVVSADDSGSEDEMF